MKVRAIDILILEILAADTCFILLAFFTTSPSEIIEKVQGKFEAIQVMLAFAGVPFWIKRKLFEDDEVHHDFRCVVVVVVVEHVAATM